MMNRQIEGVVVQGAARGTGLGFPTANILPAEGAQLPENGVYRTKVTIEGGLSYNAITNIGINPTFGNVQKTVESHIFDFDANIVGKAINVEFVSFIRAERKFASVEELVAQVKADIARVLADIEGEA
ncbi:MAG: riboflavin kinase [Defluviitaleaceae bacterium]|nr:riboflavin kinase [Defluviitaleaceae bacterium]